MPIKKCTIDGKSGFKWGDQGKCYTGPDAEKKARIQGIAAISAGAKEKLAATKVSFDYDDTLSTPKGKALAKKRIAQGNTVYIISARNDKEGMLAVAKELGIPEDRVYATGSNKAKIEKINELGISVHYDNNADVIKELGDKGIKV